MDPLFGVHQLNSNITLCLINEASPISSQVYNYCCCHHGMRKVGLNEGKSTKLSKISHMFVFVCTTRFILICLVSNTQILSQSRRLMLITL